ncbi:hypothetical protein Pint_00321 [Pistacia integerrima]|uniref:Uncharacterized protein n=1 Tax=Pistacia integerrima TaxID=434235 RepID=A0ACC0ZH10_9ROSI|nr:hypothetical protein Pint_00321 [Pistacia integerrima]
METYKRWVRRNRDYVHSLESLANGLTWLLPERFSESEIGPEAVTTILGIITALNEHIIETTPSQKGIGSPERYSFPYSLCVSALKDLETLVEVVAQHYYGDDKKWNFIAITEATKVLVRLALFRNSGYKMLLHGGETLNVEEPSNNLSSERRTGNPSKPGAHHAPGYLKNKVALDPWNLEGRALSALNRLGENARMVSEPAWLQRIQHQHAILEEHKTSVVERPTLSSLLSNKGINGALFVMGEVLFITRPLIYVLFIRKYGIRSWIPWFLSLGVDFMGFSFLSLVTNSRHGGTDQKFHLSIPEKDEVRGFIFSSGSFYVLIQLKRRKLLWALYVMRDPFFSKYTR